MKWTIWFPSMREMSWWKLWGLIWREDEFLKALGVEREKAYRKMFQPLNGR